MEENIFNCPECSAEGNEVKKITVEHMLIENKRKELNGDRYYLCADEKCNVVYYSSNKKAFYKDDIKVSVWFKKDATPKYVCYCNKVTEQQVIDAVLANGARNMKDIIRLTGAMKDGQCEIKNPSGKCCHSIVQGAINKGLKMISE